MINKKLTIICSKEFYYDGKSYKTTGGFGRYIEEFARHFKKVDVCIPVYNVKDFDGYEVKGKNITFKHLPPAQREYTFAFKTPKKIYLLKKYLKDTDYVHILIPSYDAILAFLIARKYNKPTFGYMGSDWEQLSYYSWRKGIRRPLSKFYSLTNDRLTKKVVDSIPMFLLGDALYKKYYKKGKPVFKTINSALSKKELSKFKDKCNKKEIQLLYVGRLAAEKGITYLLDSVKELKNKNYKIKLNIVGDGPYRNELPRKTKELDIEKEVNFIGFVSSRKKLNSIYRNNDIFILPSTNDALAKVLIEAMAASLPVIATDVGGLSTVVKNNKTGLLIKPRSSKQIEDAVKKIVKNKVLRHNIIKGGLKMAEENTVVNVVSKRIANLRKIGFLP